VQLAYARHEDFYILDPDVRMGMPLVKKMYEKALIDPSIVNKDYKNIAEKYIKDFCGKPERPLDTVYWVNKIKRENSYRGFLKTLVIEAAKMTAIELGLKGSRGIWRQRSGVDIFKFSLLKFWQLKRMKSRDFTDLDSIIKTNKYIYYPLHVDPEMTTMVMADKLTDQTSVIEHLSKQIPAGWKVVVKDHIPMIGKRSKAFYDRIRSMPDVCLVSPFEDNFKCMKHSETICTITGTAGWESMLLGKVPIVMGYPHYINLQEGFVHCTEPTKLSQAIKESQQLDVVSKDKMTLYAACMLDNAFDLPTSYYWFNDTLTDDHFKQSTNDLANKLSEYL